MERKEERKRETRVGRLGGLQLSRPLATLSRRAILRITSAASGQEMKIAPTLFNLDKSICYTTSTAGKGRGGCSRPLQDLAHPSSKPNSSHPSPSSTNHSRLAVKRHRYRYFVTVFPSNYRFNAFTLIVT